ncbi:MAG: YggS family pyridoxal phosphate-dependent enzyme [Calditrichota bacterium]
MQYLAENLRNIQSRIREAEQENGLVENSVTLVGVSKTFGPDVINAAIDAGLEHIGENRIQEFRDKSEAINDGAKRHFIGHLQRNKVKYAAKLFDIIQSVDSIALAEEINARCSKLNRQMPILIEVNTSGEAQKMGCEPTGALTLLKAIDRLPNLNVQGFMTIALYSDDAEKVRPCFKLLKELYDEAQTFELQYADIKTLSMGMSGDFPIAISEGANMVRIGSALFGKR